ncbi:MAG: putative RNA methyltransferase [Aestuariibacter sp.]
MLVAPFESLACPIDSLKLTQSNNQLLCPNNHSFDIARQRYVNLLPIQDKRSRHPGDSKEMIDARRRFLNTGIYEPICEKVNALALQRVLETPEHCNIVDAGCGEGYYLQQLYNAAQASQSATNVSFLGVDISKPAIVGATQRERNNITWAVGTNRKLPVVESTTDVLLCMFGFPVFDAFKQCLKPSGAMLLVESGPAHLIELRELIYDEVKISDLPSHEKASQLGFQLYAEDSLTTKSEPMSAACIQDLLVMTPHFFKVKPEKRELIAQLPELTVTIDVRFRLYTLTK